MKAQEIMMFLLIFNLCISLVGFLHIYNLGINVNETYNVSNYDADASTENIAFSLLGTTFAIVITGVVAGAMTSWLTRIPTDAGIAYGIFVTVFLLPCTIGPYIIAAGLLSKIGFLSALPWLLYYNLLFVIFNNCKATNLVLDIKFPFKQIESLIILSFV